MIIAKSHSVIDWDTVSLVPTPAAIQFPVFMANIPGFLDADISASTDFINDRLYLEQRMRGMSPDGEMIADMLSNSCEREFFEMSLRNKRINAEYIRLNAGDGSFDQTTLGSQLEEFLLKNPDMIDDDAVIPLGDRIRTTLPREAIIKTA
nr:hypothetical protein CFP56_64572 [Quercus suber]